MQVTPDGAVRRAAAGSVRSARALLCRTAPRRTGRTSSAGRTTAARGAAGAFCARSFQASSRPHVPNFRRRSLSARISERRRPDAEVVRSSWGAAAGLSGQSDFGQRHGPKSNGLKSLIRCRPRRRSINCPLFRPSDRSVPVTGRLRRPIAPIGPVGQSTALTHRTTCAGTTRTPVRIPVIPVTMGAAMNP